MDNEKVWYLLSVIAALAVFSVTALILPGRSDTSSLEYLALFVLFTLGAAILLFFAARLLRDGVRGIYRGLSLLLRALRKRRPPKFPANTSS